MSSLPSLFVSHGAPTFALRPGKAGAALGAFARASARPRAIVVVSPHWMTRDVEVSAAPRPQTIHDFGGFDPALYDIHYPAPGEPELAQRVAGLLREAGWKAATNDRHGLDHGAWVPLLHLYPDADVPVIQVSMPVGLDGQSAFALGRALAPLASEGVLVIGSGSLTHNLYEFRQGQAEVPAYLREFTQWVRDAIEAGDADRLMRTMQLAPHAQRAHPTDDHFLPLLVALGAAPSALPVTALEGGVTDGVLVMDSFAFGAKVAVH